MNMAERKELNMNETEQVAGGNYINVTMTIGQIVETNHNLAAVLIQNGIPATGNRGVMGMSLYEVASMRGVDPYRLEDIMNDYLSSK